MCRSEFREKEKPERKQKKGKVQDYLLRIIFLFSRKLSHSVPPSSGRGIVALTKEQTVISSHDVGTCYFKTIRQEGAGSMFLQTRTMS